MLSKLPVMVARAVQMADTVLLALWVLTAAAGGETRVVMLGTGTPNADPERRTQPQNLPSLFQ
jgi:hypothetical protein